MSRVEALQRDRPGRCAEAEAHRGFTLLLTLLDLCGKDDAGELPKVMDPDPA